MSARKRRRGVIESSSVQHGEAAPHPVVIDIPCQHPNNPYAWRNPDFSELAQLDPAFAKLVYNWSPCLDYSVKLADFYDSKYTGTGNPTLDFHDPRSTLALTSALLRHDWGISFEIPEGTLCPTIPNRLQYLVEIEGLLHLAGHTGTVQVLDIGTGYSAIYPLLGCRLFPSWSFISTDIDERAVVAARSNIERNGLGDRIQVLHVLDPEGPLLSHLPAPPTVTMCNPPFYESTDHRTKQQQEKQVSHPVTPAVDAQVATEGGEAEFILRMIRESQQQQQRDRAPDATKLFTSLMGFKATARVLEAAACEAQVPWYQTLSFRLGSTTRWIFAWSWDPLMAGRATRHLLLSRYPHVGNEDGDVNEASSSISRWIRALLDHLQVHIVEMDDRAIDCSFQLATWARRWKRRKLALTTTPSATPIGDGVTGTREQGPLTVRIWWTPDQYRGFRQPMGECAQAQPCIWLAGEAKDPLFLSFYTYLKAEALKISSDDQA
ncbi:hypothetical protein BC828DRAFT_413674 [Blastocladiella britannica]|nr:hypothetical protein BC828DRAFT_413674 [Blastocladiella britannica]